MRIKPCFGLEARVELSGNLTLYKIIGLAVLSTVVITALNATTIAEAQLESLAMPTAITATAISDPTSSASSASGKQFSTVLTGDNEVPPIDTEATGRIRLNANSQQSELVYQLSISNLNGMVTGAHIHRGNISTNGPIVANLNIGGPIVGASASASAGSGASSMTSTSTGGTITSADLKGPLSGKQISDLIKLIEDGNAYVNVYTDQNPTGEFRGQLKQSSSSSDIGNEGIDTSIGASASASALPSASASAIVP
ncbi:MAG TPA: CHRD domain-containing protein [Nitrososphaeraceae archaeon]|nr:CHRD domain-containing protein [Nitrososphaeraceae archaeon]